MRVPGTGPSQGWDPNTRKIYQTLRSRFARFARSQPPGGPGDDALRLTQRVNTTGSGVTHRVNTTSCV